MKYMAPGLGLSKGEICKLLEKIGNHLQFIPVKEVNTGFSKVDLVWFDKKVPLIWLGKQNFLEKSLALPVVGFEIEEKSFSRKPIRGSMDSLNSLSPILGVIIFSSKIRTVTIYNEKLKQLGKSRPNASEKELSNEAIERADRDWQTALSTFEKFAAASPKCRIVLLEDSDIIRLAKQLRVEGQ